MRGRCEDALALIMGLRLEHQAHQLRAGQEPDDYIDPATLTRLTRSYLKEAFRAVASIQKDVAARAQRRRSLRPGSRFRV